MIPVKPHKTIYYADREAALRAAKTAVKANRVSRLHRVTFAENDLEAFDILESEGVVERHIWKK